jgi:DNA replication protein DnaC
MLLNSIKLEQVREGLRKLERNRFLVIVGMAGCGKSVLATQAVNDSSLVMSKYSV